MNFGYPMARPFSMLLYCYYSVGGHLFTFWRVCPHDGVKIANVAKGMGNFRQLIICLSLRKKSCRVWWGCVADNENITCFWSPNWPRILKSRAMPRELLKIIIKKHTYANLSSRNPCANITLPARLKHGRRHELRHELLHGQGVCGTCHGRNTASPI